MKWYIFDLPFSPPRYTGKLCTKHLALPPMCPDGSKGDNGEEHETYSTSHPELNFMVENFRTENLLRADDRLKKLWWSLCYRDFNYLMQTQRLSLLWGSK